LERGNFQQHLCDWNADVISTSAVRGEKKFYLPQMTKSILPNLSIAFATADLRA
jgi:hypothetical protein